MSSANVDDLLLELMARYKPHLQSYKYKIQTWSHLLYEFNKVTGCNIKQVRTLKKRFERLREKLLNGTSLKVGNRALLCKLVAEVEERQKGRRARLGVSMHGNGGDGVGVGNIVEGSYGLVLGDPGGEAGRNEVSPLDAVRMFTSVHMKPGQNQIGNSMDLAPFNTPSFYKPMGESSPNRLNESAPSSADTYTSQHADDSPKLTTESETQLLDHVTFPHAKFTAPNSNAISVELVYEELLKLRECHEQLKRDLNLKLDYISNILNKTVQYNS